MPMKENKLVDLVPGADLRGPAEIKSDLVEVVWIRLVEAGANEDPNGLDRSDADGIVNAVLTTIIDHSQSPRTVDELTLIRGAGE